MNPNTNIGWQYYRNYFHGISLKKSDLESENTEKEYKRHNLAFTQFAYKVDTLHAFYENDLITDSLTFKTTYPGLMVGTGYAHEVAAKGELKLGMFFDHTTGLPLIPGTSVKGLLRSAFPQWGKDTKTPESKKWTKTFWIKSLISGQSMEELSALPEEEKTKIKAEISAKELSIFEGENDGSKKNPLEKYHPVYDRDMFFDAVILHPDEKGYILGTDAITPHVKENKTYEESMLTNPVPIPFLKILPEVTFKFHFRLTDNGIPKDTKKALFEEILKTFGIGAKTNVGYGQFQPLENKNNNPQKKGGRENEKKSTISDFSAYRAADEKVATIKEITDTQIVLSVGKDELVKKIEAVKTKWAEIAKKKNKDVDFDLEVGKTLIIRVKNNFTTEVQNFTVLPIFK